MGDFRLFQIKQPCSVFKATSTRVIKIDPQIRLMKYIWYAPQLYKILQVEICHTVITTGLCLWNSDCQSVFYIQQNIFWKCELIDVGQAAQRDAFLQYWDYDKRWEQLQLKLNDCKILSFGWIKDFKIYKHYCQHVFRNRYCKTFDL